MSDKSPAKPSPPLSIWPDVLIYGFLAVVLLHEGGRFNLVCAVLLALGVLRLILRAIRQPPSSMKPS